MKQKRHNGWRGFLIASVLTCCMAATAYAADSGVITGNVVNIRKGPGTSYDRVEMLAAGRQVKVLGVENGWYHISWNNSQGYVYQDYLAVSEEGGAAESAAATNASVTGGTVNVRSGPGTNHGRVTIVSAGKRVTVLDKDGDWYHISFDGKTGYIYADYLKPDESPQAAAPAPQETVAESAAEPAEAAENAENTESVENAENTEAAAEETSAGIITGGTINVRSGPGTEYARLTRVTTGKRVTVLGKEDNWYHISFDDKTGYVREDFLIEGDSLPSSGVGDQVAALAMQYLGTRYVYGGSSPSGFDCSGFTSYLYRQYGYSLPHTASGQYATCGYKVAKSDLQVGDLVFFTSSGAGGSINHVGLYIGDNRVIHARMSIGQVYINDLSESYYSRNYVGAVRIM